MFIFGVAVNAEPSVQGQRSASYDRVVFFFFGLLSCMLKSDLVAPAVLQNFSVDVGIGCAAGCAACPCATVSGASFKVLGSVDVDSGNPIRCPMLVVSVSHFHKG